MTRPWHLAIVAPAVVLIHLLCSALAAAGNAPADHENQIRHVVEAYVAAIRRGDADALVKFWTPDGTYIDETGRSFNARDLIRREFSADSPELDPPQLHMQIGSIRLVAPSVAVEDGITELTSREGQTSPRGRYTAIWVQRDGRWLLDSVRDSRLDTYPTRERLDELEWMIGDWRATKEGINVHLSAQWSEDRNYILRRFEVRDESGGVLKGTQRIGWDPKASKIRCWTFDSDGSYNTGYWRKEGSQWIVRLSGVSRDGEETEATHSWQVIDGNRCLVKIFEGHVGEQVLPFSTMELERETTEP